MSLCEGNWQENFWSKAWRRKKNEKMDNASRQKRMSGRRVDNINLDASVNVEVKLL